MRAGGDGGVRGPREACAAGCAGQGRQRRVRPAIIAVGGRACTGWDDGEERERARYGQRKRKDGNDEWDRVLEIECLE